MNIFQQFQIFLFNISKQKDSFYYFDSKSQSDMPLNWGYPIPIDNINILSVQLTTIIHRDQWIAQRIFAKKLQFIETIFGACECVSVLLNEEARPHLSRDFAIVPSVCLCVFCFVYIVAKMFIDILLATIYFWCLLFNNKNTFSLILIWSKTVFQSDALLVSNYIDIPIDFVCGFDVHLFWRL